MLFRSEDRVQPGRGFPMHPHHDLEIVMLPRLGAVDHLDSEGRQMQVQPGELQWMRAGRGIIHSEMPEQQDGLMEGFQLWVNLPAALKMSEPGWRDIPGNEVPEFVSEAGVMVRVVAGSCHGVSGAVVEGPVDPLFQIGRAHV